MMSESVTRPTTTADATIADTNMMAPKTASEKEKGRRLTNPHVSASPPPRTPASGGGVVFWVTKEWYEASVALRSKVHGRCTLSAAVA